MADMNDYFGSIDDVYSSAVDQGEAYITAVAQWMQSLGATSGDDPVYVPITISGTGIIRWTDENGVQKPVSGSFSVSVVDGVSFSPAGVSYSYVDRDSSGSGSVSAASLQVLNDSTRPNMLYRFTASSNKYVRVEVDGDPSDKVYNLTAVTFEERSETNAPRFAFNQTFNASNVIGVSSVNFSTAPSDSHSYFNLPVGGTEITYNNIVPMVVNIVNQDFPEETITEDDLPSFDDTLPTEPPDPTEPSGGGGDTYINNGSLYWNSGDGTQNIYDMDADVTETVETFDNYEDELRTLEFETLPSVTENANTLEVASSMVEGGLSMLPTGFLDIIMPASIFCAVISMLIRR